VYICNDPVCDPVCDFCWFCQHDGNGVLEYCTKGRGEDFSDCIGYCEEFKRSPHEQQP